MTIKPTIIATIRKGVTGRAQASDVARDGKVGENMPLNTLQWVESYQRTRRPSHGLPAHGLSTEKTPGVAPPNVYLTLTIFFTPCNSKVITRFTEGTYV